MQKQADLSKPVNIILSEWTSANPQSHPLLANFSFENDPPARRTAQQLTQSGKISLIELANGLEVHAYSTVGSIRLGQLSLTIVPKINGLPLMRLLRYAYNLRNLELFDAQLLESQDLAFQDLLIFQLIAEVEELFARGLKRSYVRIEEILTSPMGRMDFQRFARRGGLIDERLPCVYYHRLENCLHNQVILSGLLLATHLTKDLTLRSRARQFTRLLLESIEPVHLNRQAIISVARESNRLTEAYRPAIKIISLLLGETGMAVDEDTEQIPLLGFLFDMNHFFQALLSRLLNDYLEDYDIEDEYKLQGFLSYVPGYELPSRHDPLPRPDFAVFQEGKFISLLDAKYRDLWQEGLPRDMLYQLIVYALSQRNNRTATILYPTLDDSAREARIQINEPIRGLPSGIVVLRPVFLRKLEELITTKEKEPLESLAYQLVFGIVRHG